jgi:hypothetical protein
MCVFEFDCERGSPLPRRRSYTTIPGFYSGSGQISKLQVLVSDQTLIPFPFWVPCLEGRDSDRGWIWDYASPQWAGVPTRSKGTCFVSEMKTKVYEMKANTDHECRSLLCHGRMPSKRGDEVREWLTRNTNVRKGWVPMQEIRVNVFKKADCEIGKVEPSIAFVTTTIYLVIKSNDNRLRYDSQENKCQYDD